MSGTLDSGDPATRAASTHNGRVRTGPGLTRCGSSSSDGGTAETRAGGESERPAADEEPQHVAVALPTS